MNYKEIIKEQLENALSEEEIEEIYEQTQELSGGLTSSFTIEGILESTLNGESIFNSAELIGNVKTLLLYEVKTALILGVEILVVCIIVGLLNNLASSFKKKELSEISVFVCVMVIIGISINSFKISYDLCMNTISTMVYTMEVLTPILIAILISTGAVTSGTILSPVILGAVTGFGAILKNIILPALFASTILSLVNNLTEKNYVNKLSKLIRNAAIIVTGLIVAILSGIISVQGLITETSDGLLINTAKYSINTFIPIVGSFTSDTVELFMKCMSSIKGVVGVFGIITLIVLIILPLIKILVIAFIYKVTAAVVEPISETHISEGLNDMGNELISMSSLLFFSSLLFIIFLSVIVGIGGS